MESPGHAASGADTSSVVVGMVIGAAAAVAGVALIADMREVRSSLANEFSNVTGLPPARFVLPLRLLGVGLCGFGLVVAILALSNLG